MATPPPTLPGLITVDNARETIVERLAVARARREELLRQAGAWQQEVDELHNRIATLAAIEGALAAALDELKA